MTALDNCRMENPVAEVRRNNLQRLLDRRFKGNRSALARAYGSKQSYISDLLRASSGRSFGEKTARALETSVGLQPGQLDVPDSPLLMDESRKDRIRDDVLAAIEDLDNEGLSETLEAIRKIQERRAAPKRRAAS